MVTVVFSGFSASEHGSFPFNAQYFYLEEYCEISVCEISVCICMCMYIQKYLYVHTVKYMYLLLITCSISAIFLLGDFIIAK